MKTTVKKVECAKFWKFWRKNSTHPFYLFWAKDLPSPLTQPTRIILHKETFHPPPLFQPLILFRCESAFSIQILQEKSNGIFGHTWEAGKTFYFIQPTTVIKYFYVAQICENKFANTNKTLEMRQSDRASIAKVIPLN